MRFQGFIGPSYTLQSVNVDCQRCINLYPEIDEMQTGNEGEVASLVSTPGLKLLVTLPTGPVRGVFCDSQGNLWAVGGNTLYQISSSWVATAIGQLETSQGPVNFSDNGLQAVAVDGSANGYYWTLNSPSSTYAAINDASFYGANTVTFLDTYLIFNKPNTQVFYITSPNQVVPFNGLDAASAEGHPDNLLGLCSFQQNLYLFSQKHLEVWYDSGAASFPITRVQSAVLELGCASPYSIATIKTQAFWLAYDKDGQGSVYTIQGLTPQRISTYAIEKVIQSLEPESLATARAYTYMQQGHYFYCLNIPGADTTWCYDMSTNLWHERASLTSNGTYSRHLADCHAFAFNTNVVGDYSSGNVYALDPNTYSDNGASIRRERTAPHLSNNLKRIFHARFWLDMEMGLGLDGIQQGTDPQLMLTWSNDWGHSWSNEHWTSAGKMGARRTRALWRRLGFARDRVYKLQITDPIKVTLLGAEIHIEQGHS